MARHPAKGKATDRSGTDRFAQILRGTRLFGDLSITDAEQLAEHVDILEVSEGTTVIHEGDVGDDLYIVGEGQAEARQSVDGQTHVVNRFFIGDHFGEIGLLRGGVRIADVVAMTPMKLLRLSRQGYLSSLPSLTSAEKALEASARERSRPPSVAHEEEATSATNLESAFDRVFGRLIQQEIDAMRADQIRGERPTFDEIMDFYGSSRFLYPAKMGILADRLDAVRQTWQSLITSGHEIFRFYLLRRPEGHRLVPTNSICAFEYAPRTWQGQHLVSGQRHEYTGTLAALIGLVGGMHDDPAVDFIRLTFRPTNPGVELLFGGVANALPSQTAHLVRRRYFVTDLQPEKPEGGSPDIEVRSLGSGEANDLELISSTLHPVELRALRLDDPQLNSLDDRYRPAGLFRRREVLIARLRGSVVGSAICNFSSEGMNFSFLENAVEEFVLADDLSSEDRRAAARALTGAIAGLYRSQGRRYLVWLVNEAVVEPVVEALALPTAQDKEYGILTVSREQDSFLIANQFFSSYYRALLVQDASSAGAAG